MTMMTSHTIVRNTTIFTVALTLQKLLSFVFFIFVARFGGSSVTGDYVGALAFTSLFSILIDIGLTPVQIRETARHREQAGNFANTILETKLLLSVAAYLLVFGVAWIMNQTGLSHPNTKLLVLAAAVMVVDSFILTLYGMLRGYQTLMTEAVFTVLGKGITIAVGILGLLAGARAEALVLAVLAGSMVNLVGAAGVLVIKYGWRPRFHALEHGTARKILRSFLKEAWPFAILGLATAFYAAIDSVMLLAIKGAASVGYYSIAAKTINALQFIPSAFVAAVYPAMSALFPVDHIRMRGVFMKTTNILALIAAPIALGSLLTAYDIVVLAYGEAYVPSVRAFKLVVPSIFFVFLTFPIGALFNASNRQKITTGLMIGAVVLNTTLNLFLIPRYDFYGASIAWLVTNIAWFGAGMMIAYRFLELTGKDFIRLARIIFSGLIMSAAVILGRPYLSFLPLVLASGVVYLGAAFILRAVTREEILSALRIFEKRYAHSPPHP